MSSDALADMIQDSIMNPNLEARVRQSSPPRGWARGAIYSVHGI